MPPPSSVTINVNTNAGSGSNFNPLHNPIAGAGTVTFRCSASPPPTVYTFLGTTPTAVFVEAEPYDANGTYRLASSLGDGTVITLSLHSSPFHEIGPINPNNGTINVGSDPPPDEL